MESKKQYIAPELTVVEFKVEKGYADSQGGEQPFILRLFFGGSADGYNAQGQEEWDSDNSTFGSSW